MEPRYVWQRKEDKHWVSYSEDISRRLEHANQRLKNGPPWLVQVTANHFVDPSKRRQYRIDDPARQRAVRRWPTRRKRRSVFKHHCPILRNARARKAPNKYNPEREAARAQLKPSKPVTSAQIPLMECASMLISLRGMY
jgi:hypothetical protein